MSFGRYGPGPGKYVLPGTVGYRDHAPNKYRYPMYSMGIKTGIAAKPFGPGPKYQTDKFTSYGKVSSPAYSVASRPKGLTSFQTPGPSRYHVELVPRMKESRPPAYTMANRYKPLKKFETPGPDKYSLPSALGPKVPDKNASAAYSMAQKHTLSSKERSPGPARYDPVETDIFKNKQPNFTMGGRNFGVTNKNITPAANRYSVKLPGKCMGGFTFGKRTPNAPYITPDDAMPCINK